MNKKQSPHAESAPVPACSSAAAALMADVMCCVCRDTMQDPSLLPCGHSFCTECAQQAVHITHKCPLCLRPTPKGITQNRSLFELIPRVKDLLTAIGAFAAQSKPKPVLAPPVERLAPAGDAPPHVEEESASVRHKPGDVVNVLPRLWPGINKPGGIAWITAVSESEDTYDVKYVLGSSRDTSVPAVFVVVVEEPAADSGETHTLRTPRKSRRSTGNDRENPSSENKTKKSPTIATDASVTSKSSKKRPQPESRMALLSSQLDDTHQGLVAAFAAEFEADIAHTFNSGVTHLVVVANKHKVVEQRTMKYLKSMSAGKWVVTVRWVLDSLSKGRIVSEKDYEVLRDCKTSVPNVPFKWRTAKNESVVSHPSKRKKDHSTSTASSKSLPFQSAAVVLYGSYPSPGPPKSDLAELLWAGGAEQVAMVGVVALPVLEEVKAAFEEIEKLLESRKQPIVVCAGVESAAEFREAYSLCSSRENSVTGQQMDCFSIVNPLWVLDSISSFSLMDANNRTYKM